MRAGGSDRVAHGLAFVRAEIVGHDDIVWLEGRDQEPRDVGEEALAVDRAVEETGASTRSSRAARNVEVFQCP